MAPEIVLHAVVVEQRVVDIQQEDDIVRSAHAAAIHDAQSCDPGCCCSTGLCQQPSLSTINSASGGPHVPGSYSRTGAISSRMGSTTRHAASTQSSRVNS